MLSKQNYHNFKNGQLKKADLDKQKLDYQGLSNICNSLSPHDIGIIDASENNIGDLCNLHMIFTEANEYNTCTIKTKIGNIITS